MDGKQIVTGESASRLGLARRASLARAQNRFDFVVVCLSYLGFAVDLGSITVLRFPMAVIPFSKFRDLKNLKPHEFARNANMLTLLDTWDAAVAFAQSNPILFISHQVRLWPR